VADFSGIVICLRDFPQLPGADTGEIDAVYRFFKAGGRVGWGCLAEIGASHGSAVFGIVPEKETIGRP